MLHPGQRSPGSGDAPAEYVTPSSSQAGEIRGRRDGIDQWRPASDDPG